MYWGVRLDALASPPRPPKVAPKGGIAQLLWFAPKTYLRPNCPVCKNCQVAQEMTPWCRASPATTVDRNLLRGNLQKRNKNDELVISSVRFPVVLNEWHLQPAYLDTTTGHPSTSFTTDALLSCLEELNTTVDNAVELGVWKVIKLIAWGRMSSCNVPSPDTSSLSLTASSFIIFFWSHLGLNCLSPLSPPLLQISLTDPSHSFCQEQYLTQSKCHLKKFYLTLLWCNSTIQRLIDR